MYKGKDISFRVNEDGCWICTSHKPNQYGYPEICRKKERCESERKRNSLHIHRYIYYLLNGKITEDRVVMHICDNRKCINPLHLKAGTISDNTKDKINKNRQSRGQRKDSKITALDVITIREVKGYSQQVLADMYGVSKSLIQKIQQRTLWKHVT